MYQTYNMGVGFEVIARPEAENDILSISESHNLGAMVIGRCEKSDGKNKVTMKTPRGKILYKQK